MAAFYKSRVVQLLKIDLRIPGNLGELFELLRRASFKAKRGTTIGELQN
jgi:hypothetical protein